MSSVVVVGSQWGDEGKGKITDFLSRNAEVIARYQGGDNAGHTIAFNGKTYKLRLIPSGIFYSEKICVIGNGVVLNPKSLVEELRYLHENGVTTDNLRVSDRAHVILPYHIILDGLQEKSKKDNKIGTTNKGIGPCYMDKAGRVGIRVADLLDKETFAEKLKRNVEEKNRLFEKMYDYDGEPLKFEDIFEEYFEYGQEIKKYVTDTSVVLNDALDEGKRVLFEGAQGNMLDIDQGTYPFVTSSNPVAGGLFIRYYSNVANYDLSNRYITSDAMNYSLRLKSGKTDNTYHSLMTGSSQVLGQDRFTYWKLAQNDPKQIKQQLESMANQVKEGVNRLNARMESVAKGE